MTKPTKWHVRPAKSQISLGIHQVRSKSSLSAWWMPKLISEPSLGTHDFVGFVMLQLICHAMHFSTNACDTEEEKAHGPTRT